MEKASKLFYWLVMLVNVALVIAVVYSFFNPTLIPQTVVLLILSFTLNEFLVERRLQKLEEKLK